MHACIACHLSDVLCKVVDKSLPSILTMTRYTMTAMGLHVYLYHVYVYVFFVCIVRVCVCLGIEKGVRWALSADHHT